MKSAIFSLAFITGLAAAQSIADIPKCAAPCLTKYTSSSGIAGCKQSDIKCICSNDDFLAGIACCLADDCEENDINDALKFAQQLCSTSGVDIPSDAAKCKSASQSGSSSTASKAAQTASKTGSESAASTPGTATAGAATSTTADDAAAGLKSAGGVLGAFAAMLLAL